MTGRQLAATVFGLVAGALGCALMLLPAWLLYQRLFGDSAPALAVLLLLFGAGGAYAGWLLGMIVFSALQGPEEKESRTG